MGGSQTARASLPACCAAPSQTLRCGFDQISLVRAARIYFLGPLELARCVTTLSGRAPTQTPRPLSVSPCLTSPCGWLLSSAARASHSCDRRSHTYFSLPFLFLSRAAPCPCASELCVRANNIFGPSSHSRHRRRRPKPTMGGTPCRSSINSSVWL